MQLHTPEILNDFQKALKTACFSCGMVSFSGSDEKETISFLDREYQGKVHFLLYLINFFHYDCHLWYFVCHLLIFSFILRVYFIITSFHSLLYHLCVVIPSFISFYLSSMCNLDF